LANRSHINLCVADSTWEAQAADELDHNSTVAAWAKNDHLGFEVAYIFGGEFHKFRPDYLIRLTSGMMLIVETKGHFTGKDETKRRYLAEWIEAVNEHGGFGKWASDMALKPSDVPKIIGKFAK
jgi:type III restriction enzyme